MLIALLTALVGLSALSCFLHEAEPPADWSALGSRRQANVKLSLDLMPIQLACHDTAKAIEGLGTKDPGKCSACRSKTAEALL